MLFLLVAYVAVRVYCGFSISGEALTERCIGLLAWLLELLIYAYLTVKVNLPDLALTVRCIR